MRNGPGLPILVFLSGIDFRCLTLTFLSKGMALSAIALLLPSSVIKLSTIAAERARGCWSMLP